MKADNHISSTRGSVDEEWLDELIRELRIRNVTGAAIGDATASVREFLHDSGRTPQAEFGSPRDYADTLELPTMPAGATRNAVVRAGIGIAGFLGFNLTIEPWLGHEQLAMNLPELLWMLVPVALVAALPLYLNAGIRRLWILVVAYTVAIASMILSAVAAPEDGEQAWLSVNPGPLLLASIIVMIAVSVAGTISAATGPDDRLRNPREDPATARRRTIGSRIGDIAVQWIFPLGALGYWGLSTALRAMGPS